MTYTYVEMSVSKSTYDEIKQKLINAGYAVPSEGNVTLDMRGIALVLEPTIPSATYNETA